MTLHRIVLLACLALAPAVRADEADAVDEKILKDAKVGTDAAALRAFFRKRTPTADDQRQIEALVRQLHERSYQRRQKASDALSVWGPAALESLRRALKDSDIEVVRRAERCIEEIVRLGTDLPIAAVRQLTRLKPADGVSILLAYFPNADDEQVAEAVLAGLVAISDPKTPDPVLLRGLTDSSPLRRAAAAHVLGRHPDRAARE